MIDRQKAFSGTMPVRRAHRIDETSLAQYFRDHVEAFVGPAKIEQFKGGQSNPTYLITSPSGQYVLRRKPPGKLLKSAHAVDREYRIMTALADSGVPVPRTYCLCKDDSIIGTWFFVMENVEGGIFWDSTLPGPSHDERARIYASMNDTMAALHSVDYGAIGLGDYGKPGNYFARQISRWSGQYKASETETIPGMNELIEWLPANIPDTDENSIVHGDFRLDNLVFEQETLKVKAVLDWELSTLGHPLSDFAYHCMQYRLPVSLFNGIADLDRADLGIPEEEDYVRQYCERTGRSGIDHWDYYLAFNLFRVAAISQGIMGRVVAGTASSKLAREMGAKARPLAEAAWAQAQKA